MSRGIFDSSSEDWPEPPRPPQRAFSSASSGKEARVSDARIQLVAYRNGSLTLQAPPQYANARAICRVMLRSGRLLVSALKLVLDERARFEIPVPDGLRAVSLRLILRHAGETVELNDLHAPPLHAIEWLADSGDHLRAIAGTEAELQVPPQVKRLRLILNGARKDNQLEWHADGADFEHGATATGRAATLLLRGKPCHVSVLEKVGTRVIAEYQLHIQV